MLYFWSSDKEVEDGRRAISRMSMPWTKLLWPGLVVDKSSSESECSENSSLLLSDSVLSKYLQLFLNLDD